MKRLCVPHPQRRGSRVEGLLVCALLLSTACTDGSERSQAIVALVDTSGTYHDQKAEVARWLGRAVVPNMEPGDSLTVLRIDEASYGNEDGVVLSFKIDVRPSAANTAKREAAAALEAFAAEKRIAPWTDVSGAMMLASERLKTSGAASQVMLVFSDLVEELPPGTVRTFAPSELAGISMAAVRVKRLAADGRDPSRYRNRLASWEKRTRESGALDWRVLEDANQLDSFLTSARP